MHFCYVKRTCTYWVYRVLVYESVYQHTLPWFHVACLTNNSLTLCIPPMTCYSTPHNAEISHAKVFVTWVYLTTFFMREKIVQQCNHLLHATISLIGKQ